MAKLSYVSAASTNATIVSGGDTRVLHVSAYNNATGARFIRFYSGGGTTAPTAGSGTPQWRIMVPASGGVVEHLAAGDATGLGFKGGLGFTITGAAGDSDTTNTAANDVILNVWFE